MSQVALTSRRGILAAAAMLPMAALALPKPANAEGLMSLERRRAECAAIFCANELEPEDTPEYAEINDLDRRIAVAPVTCHGDVQAKLLHVQRGLEFGEMGTEEAALQQVIDWLAGAH